MLFGIDIGGTSVKTAFVSSEGEILHRAEMPTRPETGLDDFFARLRALFQQEARSAGIRIQDVTGVGVGVPGFLDDACAVVVEAVNLAWRDVPLRDRLEACLELPAAIENDANLAALGESWVGGGKGRQHLLCVTVGTGIGAGLVLNGIIYRGMNGMAGEIGHLVVQRQGGIRCNCGQTGCLETVASATAIIRQAKERMPERAANIVGASDVFSLAEQGSAEAQAVVAEAADWLGYGLALTATALNPDCIVVGGGVSKARELFLQPVRQAFIRYSLERIHEAPLVPAELGNDAGVVGAARLAQQRLNRG
ncbi:ROK family glucokinase [Alicyclobacillus contaminans]|uniref:ROK family glucokinase n=1 Tax=Alicyclobacillus contaminans TaxID=392016 RepID=UPI001FE08B91|nr:ROK family glucokinase [Alicyclobacillus contaminans]